MKIDYSLAYAILNGEEKEINGYKLDVDNMAGTISWVGVNDTIYATPFWEDSPGIPFMVTGENGEEIESGAAYFSNEYKSKTEFREAYFNTVKTIIETYKTGSVGEKWLLQHETELRSFIYLFEGNALYEKTEDFLTEMEEMRLEMRTQPTELEKDLEKAFNSFWNGLHTLAQLISER